MWRKNGNETDKPLDPYDPSFLCAFLRLLGLSGTQIGHAGARSDTYPDTHKHPNGNPYEHTNEHAHTDRDKHAHTEAHRNA
jgi:hypothetical protein